MKKTTPVKVSVLKVIYKAMLPAYYRLDSLLDDVSSGFLKLSEAEKAGLLDATSCATMLKVMFEDYLEQAETSSVEVLHLPNTEFKNLLDMSKVVELSQRITFLNTGIWSH